MFVLVVQGSVDDNCLLLLVVILRLCSLSFLNMSLKFKAKECIIPLLTLSNPAECLEGQPSVVVVLMYGNDDLDKCLLHMV